jgi:hypothetical protein
MENIVIGTTTHDSHGKVIVHKDMDFNPFWNESSDIQLQLTDRKRNSSILPLKSDSFKQMENFLALFDPNRDIDWGKMGKPNKAQGLILQALKTAPPAPAI